MLYGTDMNNISQHLQTATYKSPVMMNKTRMKVLLVEDSALLRETITETLSSCKDLVIEAFAATETKAIELLTEVHFDMILVDIELAVGNGFEVIKFTQTPGYPHPTPIVMMLTNHANTYYRALAKKLQIPYFFDKSMDFDLAIETIEFEAGQFCNTKH